MPLFDLKRIRSPVRTFAAAAAGGVVAALTLAGGMLGGASAAASLTLAILLAVVAASMSWRTIRDPRVASAEDDAREPEPPYGLMLESLPEPVLLAAAGEPEDVTGPRLLFANAAARELWRLQSPGGLLAAAVRHPLVLEAMEEALFGRIAAEAVFEEGGAVDRIWRAVARPLPSVDGHNLALLWMRDETDARRNERLRADFLANASHELRTPLASLTGFIETLRGHAKEDPGARDKFLAIMTQQAERMSRLIDDLLSLSRIELNEHIAPSGAVDLSIAATDVIDALGPLAAEREVRIEPRLGPVGAAVIIGDRDQIIQVVQNLVDNAIKYTRAGGTVTVEVLGDLTAEDAPPPPQANASRLSLLSPDRSPNGRYAALRVRDTGRGIAREYLPRLSARFYRVEGQKSGERAGTGLGLAIVKHIINRHRGGLAVESAEGEGSTFTAYFPMAVADAVPAPSGAL